MSDNIYLDEQKAILLESIRLLWNKNNEFQIYEKDRDKCSDILFRWFIDDYVPKQVSSQPSNQPSSQPSNQPSSQPSNQPSSQPSNQPSSQTRNRTPKSTRTPKLVFKGGECINMIVNKKFSRKCLYVEGEFVDVIDGTSWQSLNKFAENCKRIYNDMKGVENYKNTLAINAWNHGYVYRNKQWIPILDLPKLSDIPDFDVITPPLDV